MFYLQAGIHLQEVKILISPNNELYRAGRDIIYRSGQLYSLLAHSLARCIADKAGRGLFNNLLMSALHRTFPLAQINNIAMTIPKHLNFNMARRDNKFFNKDTVIAKGICRFCHGRTHRLWQLCLIMDHPHAFAAAASRSLDHYRIADRGRRNQRFINIPNRTIGSRHARYTC